jgi:hypothetical protein
MHSPGIHSLRDASSAVHFDPELRPVPEFVRSTTRHSHAVGCWHHPSHLLLLSAHDNGASCGRAGGRPGPQLLRLAQHNAPQVGGHRQRHGDCLLAAWMTSVRLWAVLALGCATGDICRFSSSLSRALSIHDPNPDCAPRISVSLVLACTAVRRAQSEMLKSAATSRSVANLQPPLRYGALWLAARPFLAGFSAPALWRSTTM